MPKDKLIHSVPMSIDDQKQLVEELQAILNDTDYPVGDSSVAFLEHTVHNLAASIDKCMEKERQYEQAIALERGDL